MLSFARGPFPIHTRSEEVYTCTRAHTRTRTPTHPVPRTMSPSPGLPLPVSPKISLPSTTSLTYHECISIQRVRYTHTLPVTLSPCHPVSLSSLPPAVRSVLTDDCMRVKGSDGSIWALGDAATIDQPKVGRSREEMGGKRGLGGGFQGVPCVYVCVCGGSIWALGDAATIDQPKVGDGRGLNS